MKELLYGKDATKNIVGIIPHDDESVLVFIRREDGTVRPYVEKYWSMFLTTEAGAEHAKSMHAPEWASKRHLCVPLKSHEHGFYTHLILSKSRKNNGAIRKEVLSKNHKTLSLGSAATQYMIQTGRTLMKGMNVHDVRRMQIDIETLSPGGGFPNAERKEDEIFIIAVSDNHDFNKILHTGGDGTPDDEVYVKCENEEALLKELMRCILMRDPDILEGHNFFGFDMPYIMARCKMHKIKFGIGRNKRVPYSRPGAKIKFAERDIEYTTYNVSGRHIIDTMFLVSDFDVYKRTMPSYGLKDSAKYFKVAKKDRVYIEGHKLTEMWTTDPVKVLKYAGDDVQETRDIASKLLPSVLAGTQMIPNTLQAVHTGGVARGIELLFIREYIGQKVAIPKNEYGEQCYGGLTSVCVTGRIKKLWYIDVASLYPAIMLNYAVQPASDVLGLFQKLLRLCTDMRLKTKELMNIEYEKNGESELWVSLDAEQAQYKRFINSFYGYLGFKDGKFNDFSEADRVAVTGQSILVRMIEVCTKLGCTLIECDTDGILVQPPKGREEDDALKFVKEEVEPMMPKGIKLDLDGVFEWMLSYKSKNYALITAEGELKYKGGAWKNRGIEAFGRDFMKSCLLWMLQGNWEKIYVEYEKVRDDILNKRIPLDKFMVKKNLKMSLEEYEASLKINGGKSNRAAQYEVWKRMPDRFDVGDAIFYWIKAHKRRANAVLAFCDAEHADNYVAGQENSEHYLKRFAKIVSKFSLFFDENSFGTIFDQNKASNQIDMFGSEPDFSSIVCPVHTVKTVDDLKREMQRNLAGYENVYKGTK